MAGFVWQIQDAMQDNKKNETAADMLGSRITLCKQVADCAKSFAR